MPLGQRDPQLDSCEVGPDASVHTCAERDVLVHRAPEVHHVGIGVQVRVVVRDCQQDTDPFTFSDRAAADLRRTGGDPGDGRHRRVEPQELLDGTRDELRVVGELALMVGAL